MNCFRYKLEHDYGFAPNPFYDYLTLAACKRQIRGNKNLQIGDWIVGLGSVSMGNENHIIYAMKVEEKLTFDQYWNDKRFICKKPVSNGSLRQKYGDNICHTDTNTGCFIKDPSAHNNDDSANEDHLHRDTKCEIVLVSRTFYYFGEKCPLIPSQFAYINFSERNKRGNMQYSDLSGCDTEINAFVNWLENKYGQGIHGDPCNWRKFKRPDILLPDLNDNEEE